jgi:hypothetical protein
MAREGHGRRRRRKRRVCASRNVMRRIRPMAHPRYACPAPLLGRKPGYIMEFLMLPPLAVLISKVFRMACSIARQAVCAEASLIEIKDRNFLPTAVIGAMKPSSYP